MAEKRIQRRLAAIMAVDVVGYSRMMDKDEAGTLARLKSVRDAVFEPETKQHGGRTFKMTGDGALAEFASAIEAVQCAIAIQRAVAEHDKSDSEDESIRLRIGISLGDVIVEGGDLYGNGVNVAARMESLAEPGGICVSANVREHLKADDSIQLDDLGSIEVKNIPDPINVFRVVLDVRPDASADLSDQVIQFCTTSDGVQIAYSTLGKGPPIVMVQNWVTHLELDLTMPTRRGLIEKLAERNQIVRFDQRGNGLSDREVEDVSFEAFVEDLTCVIKELGIDRFGLLGHSQGAAIAAAYAARHPEQVSHLFLYGSFARGRRLRGQQGQIDESDAFIAMIREGWGREIDTWIQMFGTFFMPDANAKQLAGFTKFQRAATAPEMAARIQLAIDSLDIADELSNIVAPTLVLHVRDDARVPFDEGRRVAAAISGARFVPMEGRNHALLPGEPAQQRYWDEVVRFIRT